MPLLAIKLKNMLPKEYTCKLKNITRNGYKLGCSGFIQHEGATVYVNAEDSPRSANCVVRTARDDKDYTGGRNFFCTEEEIAETVANLLKVPHVKF